MRQFSNYFDAIMFYESQLEKLEKQILTLLSQRKELQERIAHNRRCLEQERIMNR